MQYDHQHDAQKFGLTHSTERRGFIARLLADPRTEAFSPEIVRWLLDSLQSEATSARQARDSLRTQQIWNETLKRDGEQLGEENQKLRQRITDLEQSARTAAETIRTALLVARMATALHNVDHIIDHAGHDALNELSYFEELSDALRKWQKDNAPLLEDVRP